MTPMRSEQSTYSRRPGSVTMSRGRAASSLSSGAAGEHTREHCIFGENADLGLVALTELPSRTVLGLDGDWSAQFQ